MRDRVLALIGDAIQRAVWETASPGEGMFRLSSLGYCPRRIALSRWIPSEASDTLSRSRYIGSVLHGAVRAALASEVWAVEREVSLVTPGGLVIPGHIDGIARVDGREVLIELKVSYWGRIDDSPFTRAYRTQVQAYLMATGLDAGFLIVLGKDGRMDCEEIRRDDDHIASRLEILDRAAACIPWIPSTYPEPAPSKECRWCTYAPLCSLVENDGYHVSPAVSVRPSVHEAIVARSGAPKSVLKRDGRCPLCGSSDLWNVDLIGVVTRQHLTACNGCGNLIEATRPYPVGGGGPRRDDGSHKAGEAGRTEADRARGRVPATAGSDPRAGPCPPGEPAVHRLDLHGPPGDGEAGAVDAVGA